jgi:hypothetical protein
MARCRMGQLRGYDRLLREVGYSVVLRSASIHRVRRIEASVRGHEVEVTSAPGIPRRALSHRRSSKVLISP